MNSRMMGRPEGDVVLQCVRSFIDLSQSKRLATMVSEDIDWEKVIQMGVDHRVMPLLYQTLQTVCPGAVPKIILHRLQELFRSNATRNLFLVSELLKLLKLLESCGISAISFKGPVLAVCAYGNLSLRQHHDLDILVRKSDIFRAKRVLLSNGYQLFPKMTQEQEDARLQSHHAFVFLPEHPTYSVDLHWAVAQPHHASRLDQEMLWERVESVSLGGNSVVTFRPEEMVLVLSMHGSKHCWQQLGWICDIAQLVRWRPDLDWKRVVCEADKAGCMKGLLVALGLAKSLGAMNLPAKVSQMIDQYPRVKSIGRSVIRRLFADKRSFLMRFQRIFIVSRLKQRVRDRFLYLLYEWREAVTPNEKDQALVSLPVAFSVFYYVVRPIRLTVAYGLSRLIRGRPSTSNAAKKVKVSE
jgi:Uncharacterised nucleotidyltransferase